MEFISRKTAKFWLSKVVLRTSNQNELHLFRVLEKTSLKLLNARSHLLFCETSLNNNLLPNFTNIYIYIYIYTVYKGIYTVFIDIYIHTDIYIYVDLYRHIFFSS